MKYKLQCPVFILFVILLLSDSFYMKCSFENSFIGKLSDIACLFAALFFFSHLLPQWKKQLHLLTASTFVFSKNNISQSVNGSNYWAKRLIARSVEASVNEENKIIKK